MDVLKSLFIIWTIITTTGYANALETGDPSLLLSHPMFQQLNARLSALEEQSKIQQNQITELESRDLAQQKIITDHEAEIRSQQLQIEELNHSLTETNKEHSNIQDDLIAKIDVMKYSDNEEHAEDSSADDNRIVRRHYPRVTNVAFTAILVHTRNDLGLNQNVVFDKVETNIGNAYNSNHGVFTSPVAGTYVFHMTISSYHTHAWCKIMVNGVNKSDIWSNPDDQNSQTLVIWLNQGDDVAIQNGAAHNNVFGDGNLWTTFSGFLLRSDAEVATIVG